MEPEEFIQEAGITATCDFLYHEGESWIGPDVWTVWLHRNDERGQHTLCVAPYFQGCLWGGKPPEISLVLENLQLEFLNIEEYKGDINRQLWAIGYSPDYDHDYRERYEEAVRGRAYVPALENFLGPEWFEELLFVDFG